LSSDQLNGPQAIGRITTEGHFHDRHHRPSRDRQGACRSAPALHRGNPASLRQFEEQARYMPGANSRSVLFYAPFPLTIARGEGATLWDADGHRYADFIAEYTAGVYGHSAPEIRDAVIEAMKSGINLTGHNLLEGRLARPSASAFRRSSNCASPTRAPRRT
jgi:hypothetical protein